MTETTISSRSQALPRLGAALLIFVGVLFMAAALLADLLRSGGTVAFGLAQAMVAVLGLAIATCGVDIARGRGGEWTASAAKATTQALPLLAVAFQLGLLVVLTVWFQLENPAFARLVLPFTAFGFFVHHLVPQRHRVWYFAALSLMGFVLVLGWVTAGWLVFLTLVFVALCHLPLPWLGRVGVLLVAGIALGVLRVSPQYVPFSSAVWPILGSILMFRLMVYAYDVRNSKDKVPVKWSLAYFFLMPNVVFPLFPVVDFATFRRTYYDREAVDIYQRGIDWMARGLIHLVLYRVVYQHLTIAPEEVTTGAQLVQYMSSTFLLYLRVSGTFHFIVGILHLFGFRLPETHRFFYLASTFTDFWRRINIYWKDFMMKLVFYPVYFPLRKRGETTALLVGTLSVFLITWLTHSYQWFWILGKWLLSWTDGLFWALLGVLLVANSLWEAKHGRKRALPGAARRRVREGLVVALKATGVFVTICTLWSLWGSPTLGDWFDLMSVQRFSARDYAAVFGLLGLVAVAAFLAEVTGRSQGDADRGAAAERDGWKRGALRTMPQLACLTIATTPLVLGSLDHRVREFARDLRLPELNKRDVAAMQRGYYENLQGVSLQNSQLWELYAQRPPQVVDIWKSGIMRERPDYLGRDMKPFFAMFDQGIAIRTNRWGMRDRDYEQQKPAGTHRIALLGQSYVAGDGVNNGESFEEVAEDQLAREKTSQRPVQILNFSVGAYALVQQLLQLEERVWSFGPDAVVVFGHEIDANRQAEFIVKQALAGIQPPYPWIRDVLERAKITPGLRQAEAMSRIAPYREELLESAQRELVETCRRHGVAAIWIYLAMPEKGPSREEIAKLVEQARRSGFHALDWSDVYDGVDIRTLQRTQWDFHPNAAGHRIIARRFYSNLTTDTTFGVVRSSSVAERQGRQENR
jgi:hypothetical protein